MQTHLVKGSCPACGYQASGRSLEAFAHARHEHLEVSSCERKPWRYMTDEKPSGKVVRQ